MPIVIDPKKLDLQGPAGMQLVEILRNLADNLVPGIAYIDTELSITSKNPVQNNVITKAINSMLSADKLQVEAETIPNESSAYVNKAIDPISGFVTLTFGIPEGPVGPAGPSGDGGMSAEFKLALETLLNHVAYIDADGQDYLDALHAAMYPPADLVSISAVYTQSGPVLTTDSLDSLKSDLVVTAHYENNTSEIITSYVLSGTLRVGVSTIIVSYGGKTTTFNVTVTELSYVSNGLINRWDAIENTKNGHNSRATTWEDIVGNNDLVMNDPTYAEWTDNALVLSGNVNQVLDCIGGQLGLAENTVEVVISPPAQASAGLIVNFGVNNNVQRSACIFSDSTFNMNGNSSKSYPVGVAAFADFHYMAAAYAANSASGTFYANGVVATEGSATHSLSSQRYDRLRVGATNSANAGYPYAGKIHAIRIYNRLLTAEEIAANYAVDVARFNLGE